MFTFLYLAQCRLDFFHKSIDFVHKCATHCKARFNKSKMISQNMI